ncbi:MAG: biotin transporter BioY [Clostridia bacterium]|nr:biotin transporter BioY [Clostridia bacterium]
MSFFAALTAVFSWIIIPIPISPVPINLGIVSPILAGLILGSKMGALSQIIYLLLGTVGLPIFAGFKGGISVITGPTGGFLIGYILAAYITGILYKYIKREKYKVLFSVIAGVIMTYICGGIFYAYLFNTSLKASLFITVLPFIPGDILKVVLVMYLFKKINNIKLR